MKPFPDEEFLLTTPAARKLYHEFAEGQPILDCHCHLSPRDLAEDRHWENMTELWLGGDHYKWRAMRSDGIDEACITGDAEPWEKFEKWACLLPKLAGNPLYHWSQLELRRIFGIAEPLSGKNARAVWEECNEKLKTLSARSLVRSAGVKLIYTTDDPLDDLAWHRQLKEDFEVAVLPAFRPDKALNIEKEGFAAYVAALGGDILDLDGLMNALIRRIDAFHALGCRNSDHGLDRIPASFDGDPELILRRALSGLPVSRAEGEVFRAYVLYFLAEEYQKRGWVMQLHYGALRNANPLAFRALGPDTGFDVIRGEGGAGEALASFLGRLEQDGVLPKTVIYSLDPGDNAAIGAVLGAFQSPEARGKLQQGAAWWFNDTKEGILSQLTSLASLSVLGNFIGMVTDSRSFLSYPRHEYFRRLLCALLGRWVTEGEYPEDWDSLGQLVQDVAWRNAARYFDFRL